MKLSAYQAAMIRLGQNVDQFEVVQRGDEIQDGEHFFRNVIFKDFLGTTYLLELITDDDGNLLRAWDIENECNEVKLVETDDGLEYREIEEEGFNS